MATTYKELCASVYSKIKDYDFVKLSEDEADEIMCDYIRPAIVDFECCKQDLADRDNDARQFNFTLSDINFEILSNFMLIRYLEATYINTPLMLKAHMSNTDFHKYDNKDVLAKVVEVRDKYHNKNEQLMINYSYRKDSELAKVYDEKGSYMPLKTTRFVRGGGFY